MSLVFIGSVESSYVALEELLKNKADIKAIFYVDEQFSEKISDYKSLEPLGVRFNIPTYRFKNINDIENLSIIKTIAPDLIFVIGLSQLIKSELINIPKNGVIGAHPAILPEYRGRAVIPWAIINDRENLGMTLFYINEGADTGDIIDQEKIYITDNDNSRSIYNKVLESTRLLIRNNIKNLINNNVKRKKQNPNEGSYCLKRTSLDGIIDWNKSSREIFNIIRALGDPYPSAYTYYNGKKIEILESEIVKDYSLDIIGFPGQIIEKDKFGILVKTIDGILKIKKIKFDNVEVKLEEFIKFPGGRFGVRYENEIEKLWEEINIIKGSLYGNKK